ncbi:MAG: hypothetical protein M1826_004458 [Phylliscum demangeonii]|nr:MAG: hypothetical protein M1826_004458 [Phylliscum demangeonii]
MTTKDGERASGEVLARNSEHVLPLSNPGLVKPLPPPSTLHPALYVIAWITLSSTVILFNKWILDTAKFHFPILLTTWHLGFATLMTQILARTTTLLDDRKTVKMTGRIYLRAILPIGIFFSLSLICGNLTYLYLSVAFIQMLKATTPVAVIVASWAMGLSRPNFQTLFNVSFIVLGVVLASFGEIEFVLIGFLFQVGGIIFEAIRLVLVQRLLSGAEYKMNPLVSLYYFAPICAIINGIVSLIFEVPKLHAADIWNVGVWTLLVNAMLAFALNVSAVFLIGKTSSLVLTLCGVLKDILLVAASMLIWGTRVMPLQMIGYSVALGGLIYYKLGADKMREYRDRMRRLWDESGRARLVLRKLLVLAATTVILLLTLGALAPRYLPQQYDAKQYLRSALGKKGP